MVRFLMIFHLHIDFCAKNVCERPYKSIFPSICRKTEGTGTFFFLITCVWHTLASAAWVEKFPLFKIFKKYARILENFCMQSVIISPKNFSKNKQSLFFSSSFSYSGNKNGEMLLNWHISISRGISDRKYVSWCDFSWILAFCNTFSKALESKP